MPLPERNPVVSDATPLIHLTRANSLTILRDLFGRVLVPRLVFEKVCGAKEALDSIIITEAVQSGWIEVREAGIDITQHLASITGVHAGESAAIFLAKSMEALLVIDDKTGRRLAELLGVTCIGTVGVLLKAVSQGVMNLTEFKEVVDGMVDQGFRLDTRVCGSCPSPRQSRTSQCSCLYRFDNTQC